MKENAMVKVLSHNCRFINFKCKLKSKGGFGMNELLGIAAAVIIAAFIIIPGLRKFSSDIMTGLAAWWNGSVASKIFPTV